MAPMRPAKITAPVTTLRSTIPTRLSPRLRFRNRCRNEVEEASPENRLPGDKTRVDTTVAMESLHRGSR